jgi:hypothetical protein
VYLDNSIYSPSIVDLEITTEITLDNQNYVVKVIPTGEVGN